MTPRPLPAPPAVLALGLALAMTVGACSSDPPQENYTEANRRAFLRACTQSLEDQRLVRDLCECTYDELSNTMPYDEFVAVEASLQIDALTPLPDPVAEIVADCFVAEADL